MRGPSPLLTSTAPRLYRTQHSPRHLHWLHSSSGLSSALKAPNTLPFLSLLPLLSCNPLCLSWSCPWVLQLPLPVTSPFTPCWEDPLSPPSQPPSGSPLCPAAVPSVPHLWAWPRVQSSSYPQTPLTPHGDWGPPDSLELCHPTVASSRVPSPLLTAPATTPHLLLLSFPGCAPTPFPL